MSFSPQINGVILSNMVDVPETAIGVELTWIHSISTTGMQMLHQVPRMSHIGCIAFALPAHQYYKPTQRSTACTKANTCVPKHKPEVLHKTICSCSLCWAFGFLFLKFYFLLGNSYLAKLQFEAAME